MQSIETPDDATVIFHLSEPYASFLWNLTQPGIGIVPQGFGQEMWRSIPIGTGPFRFVSKEQDEEIVLERNSRLLRRRAENRARAIPHRAGRDRAGSRTAQRHGRSGR